MQNAANARTLSYDTLTGLTYVDALVSGATLMGLYSITIEDLRMTPDMAITLTSLGYNVSVYEPRDYAGQLYTRYIIDWTPVTPTPTVSPTPTPTLTVSKSVTPTLTVSKSVTPTLTVSKSVTPTLTVSNSVMPTITPTITPTLTVSNSVTPTLTVSNSVTPTITPTLTVSNSVTPTLTVSNSVTPTLTVSNSVTPTLTVSNSVTPTITPTLTVSNSVTPTITPTLTVSNSVTPTLTPTPSTLPNVTIWNNTGAYNITGVTINSVAVSGIIFPVSPGQSKSGFTAKGFTGVTITVGLNSLSTGECISIDGQDHTTDGNYEYSNTNGSTNNVSIIYNSGTC